LSRAFLPPHTTIAHTSPVFILTPWPRFTSLHCYFSSELVRMLAGCHYPFPSPQNSFRLISHFASGFRGPHSSFSPHSFLSFFTSALAPSPPLGLPSPHLLSSTPPNSLLHAGLLYSFSRPPNSGLRVPVYKLLSCSSFYPFSPLHPLTWYPFFSNNFVKCFMSFDRCVPNDFCASLPFLCPCAQPPSLPALFIHQVGG